MNLTDYLRFLLFPLALIYGVVIGIRNWLYDHRWLRSVSFEFPVISVGNLSYGGTGKTPHVEYLIRLLSGQNRVTTLSRGYRRKTSGFKIADNRPNVNDLGDESTLLKLKFPHVNVTVGESRVLAIPQILSTLPQTDVILLDDAFQHRSVEPGLSILLTSYPRLYTDDYLLPIGTLREFRGSATRANFIVVTKCPLNLNTVERERIRNEIKPIDNQLLFFSYIRYYHAYSITNPGDRIEPNKNLDIVLFSGLAFDEELNEYLSAKSRNVYPLQYSDHHNYDRVDIENITEAFQNIDSTNKILLTTEKDAVKLYEHKEWILSKQLPLYILPIQVDFFPEDKSLFDTQVTGYLNRLKQHRKIR